VVFANKLDDFSNPHCEIEKYLVPGDVELSNLPPGSVACSLLCLAERLRKLMTSSPLSITL
jgi:hypothetical protein